jgi:hypothetical protein
MQDLSSKHIIPYMEQKIRVLNQQVLYIEFLSSYVMEILYFLMYDLFFFFASYSIVIRYLLQEKVLETK